MSGFQSQCMSISRPNSTYSSAVAFTLKLTPPLTESWSVIFFLLDSEVSEMSTALDTEPSPTSTLSSVPTEVLSPPPNSAYFLDTDADALILTSRSSWSTQSDLALAATARAFASEEWATAGCAA